MKAIVYTQYGTPDVLQIKEVEKPVPNDDEILVRIHATPVGFGDIMAREFGTMPLRKFNMPNILYLVARLQIGLRKPNNQTLGSEFSGGVAAIGKDVTSFSIGDAVFGYRGQSFGANAEYLCVTEDSLVAHKPSNMTYEEAATIPYGALTALNLLRKANIQPGQKVLINGASGSIGSYAVQLAKHYGAEVTGVCGTPRLEMVKALGADHVIDYTQEDFTHHGERYDLIVDVLGKTSFARCKEALTESGILLYASFKMKQVFQMLRTSRTKGQKVICALSMENRDDLLHIKSLVEQGAIKTVVDRSFPMEQAADAHRYVEAGQKTGHVVIKVGA